MRHLLSVLIMVFSFSACQTTKPVICDAAVSAAEKAAVGVAFALECKDSQAILDDLKAPIEKLKVCDQKPSESGFALKAQSMISSLVCPPVGKFVSDLATQQIPSSWQCKADVTKSKVQELVTDGCKKMMDKSAQL